MRIAFGHKSRVGKDTCALYAAEILGINNTKIISFAKPLYEITNNIQQTLHKPITKDRGLLQNVGMMMRDYYGADVWVNILLDNIRGYNGHIIVSDLRFINEYEALKKNGFYVVNVIKDNIESSQHISEIELDYASFDYVVYNDGSLDSLKEKIISLIESIENRY